MVSAHCNLRNSLVAFYASPLRIITTSHRIGSFHMYTATLHTRLAFSLRALDVRFNRNEPVLCRPSRYHMTVTSRNTQKQQSNSSCSLFTAKQEKRLRAGRKPKHRKREMTDKSKLRGSRGRSVVSTGNELAFNLSTLQKIYFKN